MTSSATLAIVAICALLLPSASAASSSSDNKPYSSAVTALLEEHNFTGVARVTLARHTAAPIVDFAMGTEDVGGLRPMRSDAVFPIGSNTKVLTATALYQLQEKGLVNLTQDIAEILDASDFANFGFPAMTKYCPTLNGSAVCQKITIEQLLAMNSGVNNGDQYWLFLPYLGSLGAIIHKFLELPLVFAPGTGYYYSNAGFVMAAYFVEKFSGMTLTQYFQKHIFDVLGLKHTQLDMYNGQLGVDPRRVGEYRVYVDNATQQLVARGTCAAELSLGEANGAGGVTSTQQDEAAIYYSLFNFSRAGTTLLSYASLMKLTRAVTPMPPEENGPGWYYAQGIVVYGKHPKYPSTGAPAALAYMGGTMCSHTANVFYPANTTTATDGAILFQAYQNTVVSKVSGGRAALEKAKREAYGDIMIVEAQWPQMPDTMHLALMMAAKYFGRT